MPSYFTIELRGLRFFAEHGMYPEEKKVGNSFEVDAFITTPAPKKKISSIGQTINYVEVYRIIQEVFATPDQFLEGLATEIGDRLYQQFPEMKKLVICIRKLSPPITNFSGSVGVSYTRSFK